MTDTKPQIQGYQIKPNQSTKQLPKPIPTHDIFKLQETKDKEKILKEVSQNGVPHEVEWEVKTPPLSSHFCPTAPPSWAGYQIPKFYMQVYLTFKKYMISVSYKVGQGMYKRGKGNEGNYTICSIRLNLFPKTGQA